MHIKKSSTNQLIACILIRLTYMLPRQQGVRSRMRNTGFSIRIIPLTERSTSTFFNSFKLPAKHINTIAFSIESTVLIPSTANNFHQFFIGKNDLSRFFNIFILLNLINFISYSFISKFLNTKIGRIIHTIKGMYSTFHPTMHVI